MNGGSEAAEYRALYRGQRLYVERGNAKHIHCTDKLYRYSEGTAQRTDTCKAQNTWAVEGIKCMKDR